MKISLIRRAYSPSGGAEKYLLRLAENLVEKNCDVELITAADWPKSAWKFGDVKTIDGSSPLAFANSFRELRPKLKSDLSFSLERVWEADVYRAGDGVHAAWLERLSKHSSPLSNFFRQLKKKHRQTLQLESSLYSPPSKTKIIANSQLVADEITQYYGTESERIEVIQNGFDAADYTDKEKQQARTKVLQEHGIPDEATVVLFVGSGWKRKGALSCVESLQHLKDTNTYLIVAGKGKVPSDQHSKVRFLGEVSNVRELYLAADIFILPTLYDPFSNATLEAACYGLPVITTRDNGFSEVLRENGGGSILSDPRDPKEIANAIRQWLPSNKREESLNSLHSIANHLTRERNIQSTLKFILHT